MVFVILSALLHGVQPTLGGKKTRNDWTLRSEFHKGQFCCYCAISINASLHHAKRKSRYTILPGLARYHVQTYRTGLLYNKNDNHFSKANYNVLNNICPFHFLSD